MAQPRPPSATEAGRELSIRSCETTEYDGPNGYNPYTRGVQLQQPLRIRLRRKKAEQADFIFRESGARAP